MAEQANKTRRWVLLGVGVGIAGSLAIREYRLIPQDYAGSQLGVSVAHQQAQQGTVYLIDIRTPREWRTTGIGEGAYPIDMRREDFVETLDHLTGGDRAAPVALICAHGVRSARLSNQLAEVGFTNIIDVPEGMLGSATGPGWLRTGLPVEDYKEDA